MVVGLLHPGEMGAAVGSALRGAGVEVLWASEGRSTATSERAGRARLEDAGSVAELCRRADLILSLCPPHAAHDVAGSVEPFGGIYVDANAISPATTREIAARMPRFVDGGVIGPPPREPDSTRLYLSGREAGIVAGLFSGTPLEAKAIGDEPGAASALKMAYAAWTKGSAALLLACRATAEADGVGDALLAEWRMSLPELDRRLDGAARSALGKGWRWVGEMEEIAKTFGAAGLPPGFHEAAAEVYRRVPREQADGDAAARVLDHLLADR